MMMIVEGMKVDKILLCCEAQAESSHSAACHGHCTAYSLHVS